MRFERTLGFTAYAVATVVAGAFVALAGRLRRWDWLARRIECGSPCQLCRNRCEYQAIEDDGRIHYAECFQCMECVAIKNDDEVCVPVVLARKGRPLRASGERARPAGGA
jgi:polyferredoxin